MKNGCSWAASVPRYCSAPSFAPTPLESMKRPSLFGLPPPAWSTSWLAPASGGSQRSKPYLETSPGSLPPRRRLRAVPLALVDDVVAGRLHHRRHVRHRRRQRHLHLRVLGFGHPLLERVLDAVLGGEVAGHHRRPRGRAHAGAGEGAFEADPVAPQPPHPGQVLAQPVRREVLDRPLLVADEQDRCSSRRRCGRRPGAASARSTPVPAPCVSSAAAAAPAPEPISSLRVSPFVPALESLISRPLPELLAGVNIILAAAAGRILSA